jgi:glycosyltransferase involved in cell wall biosynthesis
VKILQVVNSLDTGGAQTLIEFLVSSDQTNEHVVAVLLGKDSMSQRIEAVADVNYFSLNKNLWSFFVGSWKLLKLAKKEKPDLIHSHLMQSDIVSIVVSKLTGLRHVSTVHTTGFTTQDSMQSRLLAKVMPVLSKTQDMSVGCSHSAMKYMLKSGFSKEKSSLVLNSTSAINSVERSNESYTFLCLSRFHPMKDHRNLLLAWKEVCANDAKAVLALAGSGVTEENKELCKLINELGLQSRVSLLGPRNDVQSLLSRTKFLVISSRWGEALPMAGLEAIATGVPVITTDVGDCKELVIDPSFLVEPGNPEQLAIQLLKGVNMSKGTYEDYRGRSISLFQKNYSPDNTLTSYQKIYEKVAGSNG